jgi:hypothetical protein
VVSHPVLLPALVLPSSGSSGRWQRSHPLSPVSPSSRVVVELHSTALSRDVSIGKYSAMRSCVCRAQHHSQALPTIVPIPTAGVVAPRPTTRQTMPKMRPLSLPRWTGRWVEIPLALRLGAQAVKLFVDDRLECFQWLSAAHESTIDKERWGSRYTSFDPISIVAFDLFFVLL